LVAENLLKKIKALDKVAEGLIDAVVVLAQGDPGANVVSEE
jgi:hypothetical protein